MFKRSSLSSAVAIAIAFSCQALQAQEAPEKTPSVDEGVEEIVVSGIRESLTKAIEIKKANIQITDSIVAEDIGKFPDNNVVEALQRVTGVQIANRASGEATGVTIRGLGDVSTTVNGRQIFTGTGRDVALQDIPASLLARVDVYKTRSASQLEGGIAGNIDIATHRPFDFTGSKVVVAARGTYQSNSDKTDPNVSMLASDRWDTSAGDFGALINLSFAEVNYRDENIWIGSLDPYKKSDMSIIRSGAGGFTVGTAEGLPSAAGSTLNVAGVPTEYYLLRDAMGFTDFTGTRKRPAAAASFQWAPNESSEYLFETFYNGYRNQSFNSLVFLNTNSISQFRNPVVVPGTNVIKTNFLNDASMFTSGDGSTGKTDSWVYALGGKWTLSDNLKLKSELVSQKSDYSHRFFAMRTNATIDRLVVDFNENGNGLPIVAALDNPATASIDESLLTNQSAYSMGTVYDNGGSDHGEANTWTFDGTYDADFSIFKKFEFGTRLDQRKASTVSRDQNGNCNKDLSTCMVADNIGLANISKAGFFDGKAYVPSQWLAADGNYLLAHSDDIRKTYSLQVGGSDLDQAFSIDETNATIYGQTDYETEVAGNKLDGQIGVRVVRLDTKMDFAGTHAEVTENRVLPSLVVRYSLTDELMTRFTYGQTIRRPNFGDLNPTITYQKSTTGLEYGTASGGNPDLKPAESKNYDWSLEYYFNKSSSLYGVLFRRDVKGFVASSVETITVEDTTEPSGSYSYRITHPANTANGKLNGMEVGLVYFPDDVPDWLHGAGIQTSYTYLEGETYDPVFKDGKLDSRVTTSMYGVSKNSYSVVLAYEKEDYSARVSYVWREAFKTGYNGCCSMPGAIYSAPQTSMDAQLSYNVSDELVVTLDATNITNQIFKGYYTDANLYNNGASLYSRTLSVGMRYSF